MAQRVRKEATYEDLVTIPELGDHCDAAAAVTSTQTGCSEGCIKGQLQEQFGDKLAATSNAGV
jgi:hypothetical protein